MDYFEQARINMVNNQILPNKVTGEKLLTAFSEVPRHIFFEGKWQKVAYCDARLPLEKTRFLLSPEVFAKMVSSLQLQGKEKVLDIACGSGYSTAILSMVAGSVVAVENINSLALKAANNLVFMNINNIAIKEGELFKGAPENAPYDAIIINGAVNEVPKSLTDQLASNGKLIAIQKFSDSICKAVMVENFNNSISKRELFDCYADFL